MSERETVEALSRALVERHPGEAGRALREREAAEVAEYLGTLGERGAAVLEHLPPDTGADVLARLAPAVVAPLLAASDPHRAAVLLSRLEPDQRAAQLDALPKGSGRELRELVRHAPNTAGALMDPRVTAFPGDATVREAFARLRAHPERGVQRIYVIDEGGRLSGAVALQDAAVAAEERSLAELMQRGPSQVEATAPLETVLEAFETTRDPSLPVVDVEGRLVGVMRHAELVEAARQDASGDMQAMVGASREERALSSPMLAVRKRLPWLQVNLLTAFLAAAVVGLFEGTIERFTALAVLLPVVAGQSGNTGAQALAVTMRGLVLREVLLRHWWQVARKELVAASLNGVAVAATTAIAVFFWSGSQGLTLVIGLSMVVSMAMAGLAGALVPMGLTRLRQDPAQASSIVLTTVTDVAGFFSFLGIATLLSGLL